MKVWVRTEMQILLSMFITQTHHGFLMLQLQTSCGIQNITLNINKYKF